MNAIARLDGYLGALRARLRTHIYVRAAAYVSVGVLLIAVACIAWLVRSGFDPTVTITGRIAISVLLLTVGIIGLWLPLRTLRREDGARVFERHLPDEQGRLTTYLDARRRNTDGGSPLVELLAEDAASIAASKPVDIIVPKWRVYGGALVAGLALIVLLALLGYGPGQWGYGTRHLLLGAALPRSVIPVRRIMLVPGDATVRRNSDLTVRAQIEGFNPQEAMLYVRFADQAEWERAPMQRAQSKPSDFELKLFALRSPLKYYVVADGTRSAEHTVIVADLPRIEEVRLTYHYPEWTGLPAQTETESRDITAVAGTKVSIEVRSDAPLQDPVLVHDGAEERLAASKGVNAGTLSIDRRGRYHIAASVAGERVALSDDYDIQIVPDEKPTVQIEKPGRDWRATNIEEVPVRVQAADDFRLANVELRYSVNGGDWHSVPLDRNVKQTREQTLLELEQLGAKHATDPKQPLLSPGDLVSYYAVAKDHKRAVQTDLFMVQVQPFERRFLQQNAGGGGGMGDEQGAISERQREILLATWNLQRSDERSRQARQQLQDNAKMLADMQTTLAQQARTLAARTRARSQVEEDERIKHFVESLEKAALAMDPAAGHLSAFELKQAVPAEQQALQQLLRAETAFREVQVSMQNESGGQGEQAARDFSEMFELEMDVEKSQYESEQQVSQESAAKEMEEAARKLKELAERQEQLAQEANRNQTMTPEQRWHQEQLRREAEDLRRRLAALNQQQSQSARSQSQSQPGSEAQSESESQSQSESSASSQGGSKGQQSQSALQSMDRALAQMQEANRQSKESAQEQAKAARQASQDLKQAAQQLERKQQSGLDGELNQFADRAAQLEEQQREIESELYQALSEGTQPGSRTRRMGQIDEAKGQSLVEEKQQMAEALSELQKDLRDSVHEHRADDTQAKQRLTEIVNDVEASDLMYRVRRSAAEIYYGRARDAAAREGIITESVQALEQSLREAALQASEEGQRSPNERSASDRLLAEVADLRRRVEQRERLRAAAGESQQSSEQASQEGAERQGSESSESQGSANQEGSRPGERQGSASANTGDRALSAWDPNLANRPLPNARNQGQDSIGRAVWRSVRQAAN
jgi:hypothetical protein